MDNKDKIIKFSLTVAHYEIIMVLVIQQIVFPINYQKNKVSSEVKQLGFNIT